MITKNTILGAAMLLAIGISACTQTEKPAGQAEQTASQKSDTAKNLIAIVEIPTTDFKRAVNFYQLVLGTTLEQIDMQGTKMGLFPNEEGTVNVALVHGPDYTPSANGTVAYLDAGDDLQPTLNKVEPNGGKIIVPKTEIPDMGFFAMFIDSEGNRVGLFSKR